MDVVSEKQLMHLITEPLLPNKITRRFLIYMHEHSVHGSLVIVKTILIQCT